MARRRRKHRQKRSSSMKLFGLSGNLLWIVVAGIGYWLWNKPSGIMLTPGATTPTNVTTTPTVVTEAQASVVPIQNQTSVQV